MRRKQSASLSRKRRLRGEELLSKKRTNVRSRFIARKLRSSESENDQQQLKTRRRLRKG